MEELPAFAYHPDPVGTGSIKISKATCLCCHRTRDAIYQGPSYADEDLEDALCPWCIADGSAHRKFNVEFIELDGEVPGSVAEIVSFQTPGFPGWQQERWLTCCDDAAVFLGPAGFEELRDQWPEALTSIRDDSDMNEADWEDYLPLLHRERGPTAYVFRCRHCGALRGYSDCH